MITTAQRLNFDKTVAVQISTQSLLAKMLFGFLLKVFFSFGLSAWDVYTDISTSVFYFSEKNVTRHFVEKAALPSNCESFGQVDDVIEAQCKETDFWWGALTLTFAILPGIIKALITFIFTLMTQASIPPSLFIIFLNLLIPFPIYMLIEYLTFFIAGLEIVPQLTRMVECGVFNLQMTNMVAFEGFVESAPQMLLQGGEFILSSPFLQNRTL